MNISIVKIIIKLYFLTLVLTACGAKPLTSLLTPITVQLRWTHQAQFAGFYAADQEGYYAAEGLAVTFVEGGPTADLIAPLISGSAQFGVAGADTLILARSNDQDVRAIATIYRRSPIVFISLADSNIVRPQDFVGKTIRVTDDILPVFHAMMSNVGISSDQYTVVNVPNDITVFASGEVEVWSTFVSSFPITLEDADYNLNYVYPDDYGIHFYVDTIFTTDDRITNDPDLALRFLRATLRGWTYAIENPDKIGQMVLMYDADADVSIQTRQMLASAPLINTGEDHIGWMKPEVWSAMEQALREQNVLTLPVDATQVYTLQFLQEIYR